MHLSSAELAMIFSWLMGAYTGAAFTLVYCRKGA